MCPALLRRGCESATKICHLMKEGHCHCVLTEVAVLLSFFCWGVNHHTHLPLKVHVSWEVLLPPVLLLWVLSCRMMDGLVEAHYEMMTVEVHENLQHVQFDKYRQPQLSMKAAVEAYIMVRNLTNPIDFHIVFLYHGYSRPSGISINRIIGCSQLWS